MESQSIERGFERVWQMFQETDRKFKETDRKFKETDEKFKETDRKFKETDEKFKETDRKFQESGREFAERLKKTEDLFIGRWGRFMEVLVDSGAVKSLRDYGLGINRSASSVKEEMQNGEGRGMEIDVLCWGDELIVAVEVKTTLKNEDVREHEERLGRFFECFPRFSGMRLHGAVAALSFAEESDRYAYKRGMYVLTLIGDTVVRVVNDKKFRPREW